MGLDPFKLGLALERSAQVCFSASEVTLLSASGHSGRIVADRFERHIKVHRPRR